MESKNGNKGLSLASMLVQEVFLHPSQMFGKKEKLKELLFVGMGLDSDPYIPG